MTLKDTGGPAYPIADPFSVKGPATEREALRLRDGMSLRDYFAAKAMDMKFDKEGLTMSMDQMAVCCYKMADAMLEARK